MRILTLKIRIWRLKVGVLVYNILYYWVLKIKSFSQALSVLLNLVLCGSCFNLCICFFFSGKTFDNGKSTISTKGTICGGKAVGISVDVNVFQPHILAANLAHAIGHNVGFSHDALDPTYGSSAMCSCPDWHGCLMRPSIIGEEGIWIYFFCNFTNFFGPISI